MSEITRLHNEQDMMTNNGIWGYLHMEIPVNQP